MTTTSVNKSFIQNGMLYIVPTHRAVRLLTFLLSNINYQLSTVAPISFKVHWTGAQHLI